MLKNVNLLALLLLILPMLISCGDDSEEGVPPPSIENGFSINEAGYTTSNAYLIFHGVTQYDTETGMDVEKIKNQFTLLFLEGTAISENGRILYSTDSKQSSLHHFRDFNDEGIQDEITGVDISTQVYVQSPNTTTRIGISDISPDVVKDGKAYGNPSLAGINYLLTNEDEASFAITALDIDYESMSGTISCEYSIAPSWEGPIVGKYEGSFRILIE